jgi:hypothetical protein
MHFIYVRFYQNYYNNNLDFLNLPALILRYCLAINDITGICFILFLGDSLMADNKYLHFVSINVVFARQT